MSSAAEHDQGGAAPSQISTADGMEFDRLRRRLLILLAPTIVLIVICWRGAPWPAEALMIAWTAYFFLCATSLFHEFIHRVEHFRCRAWAEVIGTVILTPALAYRESHVRHHAYLNRPVDWELWPYSDPGCSRAFRRLFAWADLLLGLFTSPYIYGRIYWHRQSPLPERVRRAIGREYLAIVLLWTGALAAVTVFQQWPGFLRAWLLPWWIAGILQTGRKFTEHLGMASYDPLQGTRTVHGGNAFTAVCSWLNSDIFIHGPHHRTPRVTADELHAFADELMNSAQPLPFYRSYFSAVRAMLPHLLWNPGVGENATEAAARDVATV
jgi:fatty acid desaturase